MKKTFIALIGIAAMAFASCQPKELAVSTPSTPGVREVAVTLSAAQPATRTFIEAVQEGWQPKWHKGDSLTVTYLEGDDYAPQKGFGNNAEDGITGSFSGSVELADGTHSIYAFYPREMKDGRSGSTFKFKLPAEQNLPGLGTFDPAADLLVSGATQITIADGKLVDAAPLDFTRMLAVAKVVIADGTKAGVLGGKKIRSVTLKSSAATLTGRLSVDILKTEITAWEGKSSYNYVTASYEGDDWTADGQTGAFVIINPTTLAAGTTITAEVVTDDSSIEISRSATLSQAVSFVPGKINTLKFVIDDSDIEQSTGIVPTVWDFSQAGWQEAFAKYGKAETDITGWNLTLDNLTIYSTEKSKYSTSYFQWGGKSDGSNRVMKFTANTAGKLTVWSSNTGNSEDLTRLVNVKSGNYAASVPGGSANTGAPSECIFKNVPAGEVSIYPTGNGLRFYRLKFTGEVAEVAPGPDPEPETGGNLECTTPPAAGTVDHTVLYGYAKQGNVTGGEGASSGNILHFNNGKALQTWLLDRAKSEKKGDHSPVTIWLSGTFGPEDGRDFSAAHPWFDVKEVSNLSFYGTDSFVMDRIGIFCVRASNIIIRNINFQQPKANNGADAVSMQECDGVWVDHCTFTSLNQTKDYEDGSTDVTHGTKNVTVSWCHYIKTQKSCLVGHSNNQSSDVSITATFHHNWFDQSSSRHPRVRFGRAHVYNNLYDGCTTYGVGSAYGAKVLVEYNYFDGVQLPTDICTYPAKESNESNLQGSVAGYLYPTQNVYANRPAKAKDPYPLSNVKYTSYNGSTITPLTYDDFKPAYDYVVTAAEDVPAVVKEHSGYGKLGWADAPVAVNNGGITDPDQPGGGDEPGGDQPGGDTSAHTYVLYMNDSASPVSTMDGNTGSTFFTYSTSAADFRTPGDEKYHGPFEIDGTTYQRGFKFDSKGYVTFTTSATLNTTVQFYFARRKVADTGAKIQLIPTEGTAQVWDTPYETFGESGVVTLAPGTEYTIKQKSSEQAVILVIVTETE